MSQVQKFLIGSGCFYYWFNTLGAMRALDLGLREFLTKPNSLNGIEFQISKEALFRWTEILDRGGRSLPDPFGKLSVKLNSSLLALPANTLHLPPLHSFNNDEITPLCKSIEIVHTQTGITHFTIHPDETPISRWAQICANIPQKCRLSIENMDFRKRDYQTLEEIKLLLDTHKQLTCTFDICHWLELERSADDSDLLAFLKKYKKRIAALHLSVPSSEAECYNDPAIETSHFMVNSSSWTLPRVFFDSLPSGISIILEGVIPVGTLDSVKDELLVAELLVRASQPKTRKVKGS